MQALAVLMMPEFWQKKRVTMPTRGVMSKKCCSNFPIENTQKIFRLDAGITTANLQKNMSPKSGKLIGITKIWRSDFS
jgi:hypothetical protein